MKGHLNAGDALPAEKFIDCGVIGFFVAGTMRSEEHDAVTGPAALIAITPTAARIEINNRVDPTRTIEVGPLIGEAQVRLDNFGANGLEINAARIASEMAAQPIAAITFDFRF